MICPRYHLLVNFSTPEILTYPSCRLYWLQFSFYWGLKFLARLVCCDTSNKSLKIFWPPNNRPAYANIIHVMHETSRPIKTQHLSGCHGNKAQTSDLRQFSVN